MQVRHIGIVVSDMERSLKFYADMGFTIAYDKVERVRVVKLNDPETDVKIELLQYETMSESNLRKLGISHVAFTHDPDDNPVEIVSVKRPSDDQH